MTMNAEFSGGPALPNVLGLPLNLLNRFMPMHLVMSASGHILRAGPTLQKLMPDAPLEDRRFLDVFELRRPRNAISVTEIAKADRGRLKLAMREPPFTALTGLVAPLAHDGLLLINLSFGINVVDAVSEHNLTGTDFATTELAVDMLYLSEAKSAALAQSEKLNHQLKVSKTVAEEQAMSDTLTGLSNRRAMDGALQQLLNRSASFALMHLDLDFFKAVNDTLGHAAGDLVLCHVASVLRKETRAGDTVARVGGDEFVIIFRELTDPARLTGAASRIIAALEEPIMFRGQPCRVSASVGIALSTNYPAPSPEKMLHDADLALYASKRAGRSQATLFSDDLADMPPAGDPASDLDH